MKKYLLTFSFLIGVLLVMAQVARAETCVAPAYKTDYDCRTKDCAGLPSYPTYQFEACLTKCDNDISTQNAAYDACLERQRQAQQEQQQQEEAQRLAQEQAQQAEAQRQAQLQAQQQQQQESQSIHQPVEQLQQELQTPGPAVQPPAELNPPAAPVTQEIPNVQYLEMKNIKKGDTLTAPADSKINILTGNGKIDLKEGSVLKSLGQNIWQLISGAARFVEKMENIAAAKRLNVKTSNAVMVVRGTQFSVDVAAGGKTTVTVVKGTVNVAPTAKGKKAVDVKEGYQLSIDKNGPGKSTKINSSQLDTWYETAPASSAFFNSSWSKEAAANRYRRDCVYTTAAATPTQTLTADEQKIVDAVNHGLSIFRVKTSDLVMEKDKKVSSAKEKTNLDGTVAMQLYFDAKNIYYPGDKAGTWKTFQDKNIIDKLFKMIRQENLTYDFDKSTFAFANWAGTGKNRLAVYSGQLSNVGTQDVIGSATGQQQETGQPVGTAKIYLDEESQLWNKTEITINVQSGKIIFPLLETCQVTYGDGVKVSLPSKAKKVDAKTGNAEFSKAVSSVR